MPSSSADKSSSPSLVWFRHDLRLGDNPALSAAVNRGAPVVCVFILDDLTPGKWAHGGASRWWLHHGLADLAAQLEAKGNRLILAQGRAQDEIQRLVEELSIGAVYWNRSYAPFDREPDSALKTTLKARGIEARSFNGNLLTDPLNIRNKSGGVFKVFTPYWKTISTFEIAEPLDAPGAIPALEQQPSSLDLSDLDLLPTKPDWSQGLAEAWTPSEAAAQERLMDFIDGGLSSYKDDRNRPDLEGCSRLSPFLKFGHISPNQVWHWTLRECQGQDDLMPQAWAFLREIGWRDFSYYLLNHFPDLPEKNWKPDFNAFPWNSNPEHLKAWTKGQTGYPMVDAGMRELWQTGWMHNRVRMIVGSFLVKHLLLNWQEGERWFWDTLVDADIANNSASWQWVSGCGADAAPYFRVFNPITQGSKFDPHALYVRKYVPEVARLDEKLIFEPWTAGPLIEQAADIELGKTYPHPIVDHRAARERALAAYETIKKANQNPEKAQAA